MGKILKLNFQKRTKLFLKLGELILLRNESKKNKKVQPYCTFLEKVW